MKGCWTPGSIQGIPLRIHWSFLLIIIWSAYSGSEIGGWKYIVYSIFITCLVFVCVTLHELGHAMAGKYYGVATRSITLLPIGGVAALERIPEEPKEEFSIAIAGPLVNVIIAGMLILIFGWPDMSTMPFGIWSASAIGHILLYVNLIMIAFNLIPAFPMDGGRIFRSLLAIKLTYPTATAIAAAVGQMMAVLMFMAGLALSPVLCLIGLFVFMGARAENSMVHLRSLLIGKTVSDIMHTSPYILTPDMPLPQPDQMVVDGTTRHDGCVVVNGPRIVGVVPLAIILKYASRSPIPMVASVMIRPTVLLSPEMPLLALLNLSQSTSQVVFPVIKNGELCGVVTRTMIHDQLARRRITNDRGSDHASGPDTARGKSFIDIG